MYTNIVSALALTAVTWVFYSTRTQTRRGFCKRTASQQRASALREHRKANAPCGGFARSVEIVSLVHPPFLKHTLGQSSPLRRRPVLWHMRSHVDASMPPLHRARQAGDGLEVKPVVGEHISRRKSMFRQRSGKNMFILLVNSKFDRFSLALGRASPCTSLPEDFASQRTPQTPDPIAWKRRRSPL